MPPSKHVALRLAVVQPSPFCNIDCRYCYLPERSDTHRMSQKTVSHMAEFLLHDPDRLDRELTILWHGGEPTAVPIDFYEEAFATISRATPNGMRIQNRFSTNATLLDDEWCELIRKWNVSVRVSIDGPKDVHDFNRVERSGRGTFDAVMRGIKALQRNKIPFDVISTVSQKSLEDPEQIWRFYREIDARALFFCVEEVLGIHAQNSLQPLDSFEKLKRFFGTFLDLRDQEAPNLYIRELDELLEGIPRVRHHMYHNESIPLTIVSIGWDGGVSTFSPELLVARHIRYGDFIFGNVATHSLDDIWKSYKMHLVYKHIREGIGRCEQSCEYFRICGGGCPAAKLFETGSFRATETLSCRMRVKAVGGLVMERLNSRNLSRASS
jgi:uncharacterized protein